MFLIKFWNDKKQQMSILVALLLCAAVVLGVSGPALASMGNIRSFTLLDDADTDIVGAGSTIAPDGRHDVGFSVSITGAGAITRIALKNTAGKTWDTSRGSGAPILAVKGGESNGVINSGSGLGLFPFVLGTEFTIWINDRQEVLSRDGTYQLTVHFVDNSNAQAMLSVKGIKKDDESAGSETSPAIVSAIFKGYEKRDVTGLKRTNTQGRAADGYLVTEVKVRASGHITGFRLRNVSGGGSVFDTALESSSKLLMALPHNAPAALNKQDGSVNIPIDGEMTFHLLTEDDANLSDPKIPTELFVYMDDNRVIRNRIDKSKAVPAPSGETGDSAISSLDFRGRGTYDFVGDAPKPGSNLNPDYCIAAGLKVKGTITGIKIAGSWRSARGEQHSATWDTTPTGKNPAIVVTRSGGQPLNRLDGSISEAVEGETNLLLWFDTDEEITGNHRFKISFLLSDGRIIEGSTSSR